MSISNFWVYHITGRNGHLCALFKNEDAAKDFARSLESTKQYGDVFVANMKTGAIWYVSQNKSLEQDLADYKAWFDREFGETPWLDELYASGYVDD